MPTPISERVMAAVAAQLATITTGNGYSVTANVLRAVRTVDQRQCPAVVLWDAGESVTDSTKKRLGVSLTVEVCVFVLGDQVTTGTQLEFIKADVKQALLSWAQDGVRDADGQIGKLFYKAATLQPREPGDQTESVSITFEAVYAEGNGDPYSNAA